jgi:gliding motility-associated-like protein
MLNRANNLLILIIIFCLFPKDQKAQSLYMPAATNWVSVGDLDVPGDQLTVEALIYYTGASVDIVSKHTNPGDVNYLLRIGSFEITTTSGFAAFGGVAAAGVSLVPNRMYHVAATYDGSTLKYYVNGCMTGSMPWTGFMVQNDLITAIGNMSTCQCEQFTGYIDEVRIWNVARTQAEISANMINLPSPTTQPGLLGYWKFDGNYINSQGNAVFDGSPIGAPVFQQVPLPYPSTLHESVTSSNPVCAGEANGVINVSASGYYTPYEYSLDGTNYGSSSQFSNLSSGSYTVYTRPQNNNGCAVSSVISISDPAVMNANLTTTNVNCNGSATGSAAVAPSGGDGPTYHQIWQPSLSTLSSINNLSAGNYSVTLIDTCKASGAELVVNGHFEDGNTGFTNGYACCSGGPGNFAVDVDPNFYNAGHFGSGYGGGGNYLIVDGSTIPGTSFWCQTIPVSPNTYYTLSAFVASNYTGATAIVEFDINGVSVGTLNAPAVLYQWDPFSTVWFSGANTSASICMIDQNTIGGGNDFGVDNISFKSCTSCSATVPFTIIEPAALTATTTQTNIVCSGGNTGSATVTAAGGTGAYSYSWNTAPVQTTATASNLAAGSYTVTVTDANLCSATASVTITSTSSISASINTQTNVSCNGGSNGTATVSINGGTAPFTYSWNTTPVQTGATASSLAAGSYTVTVTDNNTCSATASVTITEPLLLTSTISNSTNVTCNGNNNGNATVTANGGATGYSYSWSTSPVQTNSTASNLSAGNYTVTVTDFNSCSTTSSVIITEPTTLSVSITSQTNVSCNAGSNGTATASATGGTSGYTYSWSTNPAQSTASANNLPAGTYTVTVSDANTCSATNTVTITEPTDLSLILASRTHPTCFGSINGIINTTASGGTGAYTYTWNPSVSTANSATNLAAGSYDITVTDANLCTQLLNVTLTDPPLLTVNASNNSSICKGLSTNISAVSAGGTPGINYSWSNSVTTASQTVQPISTTNYTVTVTDSKNCTATDSTLITVFQPLIVDLGNDTAICAGDVLVLDAGAGFNSYSWQNGSSSQTLNAFVADQYFVTAIDPNGCISKDTILLSINPLPVIGLQDTLRICPGTTGNLNANPGYVNYAWNTGELTSSINVSSIGMEKVIVQDVNGCINMDSTYILFHPIPSLAPDASPLAGCEPLTVTTINNSILNGSNVVGWNWTIGPESAIGMNPTATIMNAGLYDLYMQAVTDSACTVDTLMQDYILVNPMPVPLVVPESLEYELTDDFITINNQSMLADTYSWSIWGDSISNLTDMIYPINDTGVYEFELLAMNQYGCKDSVSISIIVNPSFAIYFPDAFSPNGNGNNDRYMPKGYGISTFEIMIYDRWGNMVYKSTDITEGWDGTFGGAPPFRDVYVYKCKIRDIKGDPHYYRGKITLIQ